MRQNDYNDRQGANVPNILDQILETKRAEVEVARRERPLKDVQAAANGAEPPRDFYAAIAAKPSRSVHLITEIKRRSPSAGLIRPDFDPARIARSYLAAGASALSVLTDVTYFDGRLEYIAAAKAAVPLPVLRKDFIVDAYQIYEARAAGADAVLLIGEALEPPRLRELRDLAASLGMTTLVEVHDEATLRALLPVVESGGRTRTLLGINNRNLKIQQIDLGTTVALARLAPPGTLIVSESGVKTHQDVLRMVQAGARALLVGETLMRSPDIAAAVSELLGG
jgi:indole-3-glycerol phosphate synthase